MKLYTENTFLNKKNLTPLLINYFAFGLQVLLGFLIVAIILSYMSVSDLGIFTQTYTILIISSQFFVTGLNDTVLKKLSTLSKNDNEIAIITNILTASFINVFVMSIIFYLFQSELYLIFESEGLIINNKFICIAIFFLTVNKVFFSILQGKRFFNSFAFFNFLRPFLIFCCILSNLIYENTINFSLVFSLVEFVIFILLLVRINIKKYLNFYLINLINIKSHYNFGFKVFINSFLSESFIRVDIIMVGILLNDKMVGMYCLAALFFEGIFQFSIVIRNVINPEIGRLYKNKNYKSLIQLIRYSSLLSFLVTIFGSIIIFFLIPYVLFFIEISIIDETLNLVKFLLFGLVLYSLIIPSENLLFQSNNPTIQSLYMLTLVFLNIILNFFMISQYGVLGAAVATSMTYFCAPIIFNLFIIFFTELKSGIFIYPRIIKKFN